MVRLPRKIVADYHRLWWPVEPALDVVVAQQARALRHVQRAVAEGDAVRVLQIASDGDDAVSFVATAAVDHRVDVSRAASADEEDSAGTQHHLAGVRDVLGVDGDVEARRELDAIEMQRGAPGSRRDAAGGQQRRPQLCTAHRSPPGRRPASVVRGGSSPGLTAGWRMPRPRQLRHALPLHRLDHVLGRIGRLRRVDRAPLAAEGSPTVPIRRSRRETVPSQESACDV